MSGNLREFPPKLPCAAMHGSEACGNTAVEVIVVAPEVRVPLCGPDIDAAKAALQTRDRKIGQAALREAQRLLHVGTGKMKGSDDG